MRALVCSGGGVKGSWECGVLKYLLGDKQIQYDVLAGVSVGALNTAFLAQFQNGKEQEAIRKLEDLWLSINNSTIKSFHFPPYISALWKSGLYSTKPLRKLVEKNLDADSIFLSGKLLRIGATSLNTGIYKVWTEKDVDIVDGVMASSSFPVFFDAVNIKGEDFVDGGVRNITPLKEAIDAGADEIDVVLASAKDIGIDNTKFNVLKAFGRSLSIIMDEVFENDLKVCALKNNVSGYKQIKLNIYRPEKIITQNSLDFDPKFIREQIEIGYNYAKKVNNEV